jgi:hypothetical protein
LGTDFKANLALREVAPAAGFVTIGARLFIPGRASLPPATLKKIGKPAIGKLLDALQAAAVDKKTVLEGRILAALEAVFGRKDHGYSLQSPLEERLKKIGVWRESLAAPAPTPAAPASPVQ